MFRWKFELHLPFFTIGTDYVELRKRRKNEPPERFALVSRRCGLALDSDGSVISGQRPALRHPTGQRSQLWFTKPSNVHGEVLIISAGNGLALDTTEHADDQHIYVFTPHGEAWQRWRLEPAPTGFAYLLRSAHSGRCLSAGSQSKAGWRPWFEARRPDRQAQQWVLAEPPTEPA